MKKLKFVVVLALLMAPMLSNAQNFDKYEEMKGVNSMLITSEMFKLLTEIDFDSTDPETQAYVGLIENLENIQVFTTTDMGVGKEMAADVKSYLGNFSMKKLMSFNDDGKSVDFYSKPGKSDEYVSELLMFMKGKENGEPKAIIMRIIGNVDLKQVSKLAEDLEVPGAKGLEKINENQ